jgi:hypothetical protein
MPRAQKKQNTAWRPADIPYVIPRKIDMDELGWKRALKASKSETDGLRLNYNS